MKKGWILIILLVLSHLSNVLATNTYVWKGPVSPGMVLYVNGITVNVTKTINNETIVLLQNNSRLLNVLKVNESVELLGMNFSLSQENNTKILTITSPKILVILLQKARSHEIHYKYEWTGILSENQTLYLNNFSLSLINSLLKIQLANQTSFLSPGNATVKGVHITFIPLTNTSARIVLCSNEPLGITFHPIVITKTIVVNATNETLKQLKKLNIELIEKNKTITNLTLQIKELKKKNLALATENKQLKQQLSQLKKNEQTVTELNAKIVNLTKQNRELKAELANLTNKYNQLKAKADFLSQQNKQYQQIIQQVMNEQSSQSKQSYIEKAKKERLIGSVIIKTLVAALVVVGLIGYGLYRKKRAWELGGL